MKARPRVAVLMGGVSAERPISLMTGQAVANSIKKELRYPCVSLDVKNKNALRKLLTGMFDVVFIALHGPFGEDGRIQGFLEMAGLPYTGSGVLASALAMDKVAAKQIFEAQGVLTPSWQVFKKGKAQKLTLALPVVVKPSSQGSAIGVTIVRERQQFARALAKSFRFGPVVLVEKYIPARELTVAQLGEKSLPVIEIKPKTSFYDYTAKYKKGMSVHVLPAPLSTAVAQRVQAAAKKAYQVLGCQGAARVDILLSRSGKVYVLEVNTIPGMTTTSLLPEAAKAMGFSFSQLVKKMLQMACSGS